MYVTAGTSLFESATWRAADELLAKVPHYGEWLTQEALQSPEARRRNRLAPRIRAALEDNLSVDSVQNWAEFLPEELRDGLHREPAMRYGAELATILKMYEEGARPGTTFRDFLTSSYLHVHVLFEEDRGPDGKPNSARVAGEHLIGYLNSAAGRPIARGLPISGLSSGDPKRLLGGGVGKGALQVLAEHFRDLVEGPGEKPSQVDLLITGGYKLYGVALAHLTEFDRRGPIFRLIYIHEEGQLMIYSERHFELAGMTLPNPIPFRFHDPGGPEA
jgi:hypothetical protein